MARTKTVARKRTKTTQTAKTNGETGVCLFSGQPTSSKRSRFLPGHDAKLKSLLLNVVRGEAKVSDIPKPALRILKDGETLVGFKLSGDTVKVVGNFAVGKGRTRKAAAPVKPTKRRRTKRAAETEAAAA